MMRLRLKCSRCGCNVDHGDAYCNPCRAAYMREWRRRRRAEIAQMQAENAALRAQLQNVPHETSR